MDYKKFSLFDRIMVILIIIAAIVIFIIRTERINKLQNQGIAAIAAWINHNAQIGKLDIPPQFRQPAPTLPPQPKEKKDAK
jgi:competence protein ComGC